MDEREKEDGVERSNVGGGGGERERELYNVFEIESCLLVLGVQKEERDIKI